MNNFLIRYKAQIDNPGDFENTFGPYKVKGWVFLDKQGYWAGEKVKDLEIRGRLTCYIKAKYPHLADYKVLKLTYETIDRI